MPALSKLQKRWREVALPQCHNLHIVKDKSFCFIRVLNASHYNLTKLGFLHWMEGETAVYIVRIYY